MSELSVTDEQVRQVGHAVLAIVASMERMGHSTLKGHLQYQHADRQLGTNTTVGGIVAWLKWIAAFGQKERDAVGRPDQFIEWACQYAFQHQSNQLTTK